MKHLKKFEQFNQIEKIDEGLFDSGAKKSWDRMNTQTLTNFIKSSIGNKSFTHEVKMKKVKMKLNFPKESWEKWAEICKTNNNDFKKVNKITSSDEILKNINIYIISRAKSSAGKSDPAHGFGGGGPEITDKQTFDAMAAVNDAF